MARGHDARLHSRRGIMSEKTVKKQGPKIVPKEREQSGASRERQLREEALDRTVEDSFPSSDPPSSIPNPGAEDPYAA
jgi:hypothetical protein